MTEELSESLKSLTPIQQNAVNWQEGSVLILAGPGAGKTRVLTTRIAKILDESSQRKFKILALTFTTKAAAEMRERVQILVPGLAETRTFIGTFHAFCTQVLRQHGSHIAILPDFGIFGQKEDQEALLKDALKNAIHDGRKFSLEDIRWLEVIKQFKARLVTPEKLLSKINEHHMQEVYQLYEDTLRKENIMDFEGLILETCKLLSSVPVIATRLRQTYPYWMIDEFQDTTPAQYWLIHYLSSGVFKNIFAVADDDQIIYQWAGASYRQIEKFRQQYTPALIQLVENHRCPPEIVQVANQLVARNTQRTPEKQPTIASRSLPINAISFTIYNNDEEERQSIANQIVGFGEQSWGKIAILGRTRSLLEPFLSCLLSHGIRAVLLQRRDNFISPQFVWLLACLDQAIRPTNRRIFTLFVNSANRIIGSELDPELIMVEAEANGHSFFEHWGTKASLMETSIAKELGTLVIRLAQSRSNWKQIVKDVIPILLKTAQVEDGAISDADEDYRAWTNSYREIQSEFGYDPELSNIVQGMALRSKEPPLKPDTITLMTIHGAKGLEFDTVFVIGLAEGEMPSWQSTKKGDESPEMEEERRNCFVAITRTKENLKLSAAKNYRGWDRQPSRFLKEMSFIL